MAIQIAQVLPQFIDANGPMNGAKLQAYQAGTTTPLNTYTTSAGDTANANPVIMDSRGEPASGGIYLIPGDAYKFVLSDSANAIIWTADNILVPNDCGLAVDTGSADTYTATYTNSPVALTDGQVFLLRVVNTNTGASTFAPNGLTAKSVVTTNGTALAAGQLLAGMYARLIYDGNGDQYILTNPAFIPGQVVQIQADEDSAVATGTTIIPIDDSIPQITEGDQVLSVTITPTNTASILEIHAKVHAAHSSGANVMNAALFQDSTANALASSYESISAADRVASIEIVHRMTAATTSATTFTVRLGSNAAGTTTFNGAAASRDHGGVLNSFLRVTEVRV